jgi:hypothetical protein
MSGANNLCDPTQQSLKAADTRATMKGERLA